MGRKLDLGRTEMFGEQIRVGEKYGWEIRLGENYGEQIRLGGKRPTEMFGRPLVQTPAKEEPAPF